MKQQSGRQRKRALACVAWLGACLVACREEVPLGAWNSFPETTGTEAGQGGSTAVTTDGTSQGAAGETGASPELPVCLSAGDPAPFNEPGLRFGATETATDWTWPAPVTSMEWDLMVEREIERASPTAPPTSGYYWAHQFSFTEGIAGFLGIQAEGGYQLDPEAPIEFTKIAVFWLSGPPLAAELGDIEYPDARVAPATVAGVGYLTIHARFDWQACRVYRFRLDVDATDAEGRAWYGAWIEDVQAGVTTFLGRMLMPADSGALAPLSVSRTMAIEFGEPTSCDVPAEASALFGRPRGDADSEPLFGTNRFDAPLGCPSSRFTNFSGAVRHELGVRP